MKRSSFLTAAALVAFITGARAQDAYPDRPPRDYGPLRFGAYIAPTVSWMRPTASKSDDGDYSVRSDGSRAGFIYGLIGEYYFAPNYALVSGLQVNSTGGKITAERVNRSTQMNVSQVQRADFDYRLQYLEIPLALKLRTDELGGFRFFGQAGITAGFNIGKKASYTVQYYDGDLNSQAIASGDKVKLTGGVGTVAPVLLQMNLGAGAEYPVSNSLTIYAGIFFNNGFTPDATAPQKLDADRLGYKGRFYDGSTRLNNFALRIGLFF